MKFEFSRRLELLPPYLFAEIERLIDLKRSKGADLITLSIGDPDLPPPAFILDILREEAGDPHSHNYSSSQGEREFRCALSEWYQKRFGVQLDPESEVAALIGSKEGIVNITRAFVNPGDRVLVPDPAYPVYANGGALLCDGIPVPLPLREEEHFLPDLDSVDPKNVKLMYLNYPNNPTGASADLREVRKFVEFARANEIILCYDNAYSEVSFDEYRPPSVLQIEGARDVAIEMHSCSKTFNMTGDRIGFAVGNEHLISGLVKVKSQIDSGPSKYIQRVATRCLDTYASSDLPAYLKERNDTYLKRARILVRGLNSLGVHCEPPKATFFVWAKVGGSSMDFVEKMLEVNVVATPGVGFGRHGEGFVRFALTASEERIQEACERLQGIL
jgi:LL-diaminopimelate aminotransferase